MRVSGISLVVVKSQMRITDLCHVCHESVTWHRYVTWSQVSHSPNSHACCFPRATDTFPSAAFALTASTTSQQCLSDLNSVFKSSIPKSQPSPRGRQGPGTGNTYRKTTCVTPCGHCSGPLKYFIQEQTLCSRCLRGHRKLAS